MTTSGDFWAGYLRRLRANWPAVLLPLVAVGTRGLTASMWPELVIVLALILVVVAPKEGAAIAPYALFAYGAYGLYLMHSLLIREANSVTYGFVRAWWRPANVGTNWYVVSSPWNRGVLGEAVACLAVGVWLLARPGSLGGGPVRRAVAQLRGTGGQPKTVPPLLLIGVIFLWEELFGQDLWFGAPWQPGITPMMLVSAAHRRRGRGRGGVAAQSRRGARGSRDRADRAHRGGSRGAVALGSPVCAGWAVERLHDRLLRRGAA